MGTRHVYCCKSRTHALQAIDRAVSDSNHPKIETIIILLEEKRERMKWPQKLILLGNRMLFDAQKKMMAKHTKKPPPFQLAHRVMSAWITIRPRLDSFHLHWKWKYWEKKWNNLLLLFQYARLENEMQQNTLASHFRFSRLNISFFFLRKFTFFS